MTKAEKTKLELLAKLGRRWTKLYNKSKSLKPENYAMSKKFEEKTPIVHKAHGWGYIVANKNDRLEVLFESGIKHLISNYQR